LPKDLENLSIKYKSGLQLVGISRESSQAKTNGGDRRLIQGEGARVNGRNTNDPHCNVSSEDRQVLQVDKSFIGS